MAVPHDSPSPWAKWASPAENKAPSTKTALTALKAISDAKRFLVVLDRSESAAALSLYGLIFQIWK